MFSIVAIIPVYQHGDALGDTVQRLSKYRIPIIVVNDGSDSQQSILVRDVCRRIGAILVERSLNGGKGAAVIDGLLEAQRQGYSHAFQIDADGQHNIDRVPQFIRVAKQNPARLVLGYPRYDLSAPLARRLGRWVTNFWVCVNSLSLKIRDSMCGFRVYPIACILDVIGKSNIGKHMEFDSELCIRARWEYIEFINLPVEVVYPRNGLSNFRMIEDNIDISLMHARMFFGMLLRFPLLLVRSARQLFY